MYVIGCECYHHVGIFVYTLPNKIYVSQYHCFPLGNHHMGKEKENCWFMGLYYIACILYYFCIFLDTMPFCLNLNREPEPDPVLDLQKVKIVI